MGPEVDVERDVGVRTEDGVGEEMLAGPVLFLLPQSHPSLSRGVGAGLPAVEAAAREAGLRRPLPADEPPRPQVPGRPSCPGRRRGHLEGQWCPPQSRRRSGP